MEKTDVLIIGGSAAGLVTGITARRHYREAKITIVRREKRGQVLVPCGIPYIFGTLGTPKKNIIPEELITRNNLDLIVDEITSIDPESRNVTTSGGKSLGYEKLVLATGSMPVVPPVQGANLKNVFCAQKDLDYLNGLLKTLNGVKDAAIIGGGFIGLEFADEFRKRGLNVTVVEVLPHCLQLVFDEEFCILTEKN